ncbi:MAG: hypothetical protein IJE10_10140 [Clostridia bacterium]|nr:hypothetical protein [Clostridia bacterium]
MEIKDWLLLAIPITCNGIILFVFQQMYLAKLKNNERTNTYKQDVLKDFLSRLQECYHMFLGFQSLNKERSGKDYSFEQLWNPAVAKFHDLIVYSDTHPSTIVRKDIGFDKCIDNIQSIIDILFECRKNNNNLISKEGEAKFYIKYEETILSMKECMARCEREIMK